MWRKTAGVVLALSIGFFLYRAALVAMPSESVGTFPGPICAGTVLQPHFDLLTGIPIAWGCLHSDGVAGLYLMPPVDMLAHWSRSVSFGFAGAALALIVLWWFGRRRRSPLQRRSEVPTSA